VDGRAHLDLDAVVPLELGVDRGERDPHVGCSPGGSERVVLVRDRQAEDRHDGVADELLDRAAVPLEGRAHRLVPPREHAAQRLRVEPLAKRR
jgi:hypothetical protein